MEYQKRCNICGKVFCYTDEDLKKNAGNAAAGLLASVSGMASALGGGSRLHTMHMTNQANRFADKLVDFNQCPYCHSRDISDYYGEISTANPAAAAPAVKAININTSAPTESLLKRAFFFLEDGDWDSANAYFDACLDNDPELGEAYLGKLMAELRVKTRETLKNQTNPFDSNGNYQKILRFGGEELKAALADTLAHINTRNENERKDRILYEAKAKMAGGTISGYEKAAELLGSIPGWKDADTQKTFCLNQAAELKEKEEAERRERARLAAEEAEAARIQAEKTKKTAIISAVAAAAVLAVILTWTMVISPMLSYNKAMELQAAGQYEEAAAAFEALGDYKDSQTQISETWYIRAMELQTAGEYEEAAAAFEALGEYKDSQTQASETWYIRAMELQADGNHAATAIAFGKAGDYQDAAAQASALWNEIARRDTIAAGCWHTVGLKSDGTVVATKYTGEQKYYAGQCDVSGWSDIVAIAASESHTVGLKSDGTVVAVGANYAGQCDVSGWRDIVAIAAGLYHTVGLKSDGTVVAVGDNDDGECDVSGWRDIVAIAAGYGHSVGLKSDGTVVAVGKNDDGQCDVRGWSDIVAISAGQEHTVGLKSDGTVVAVGYNKSEQCDVNGWSDIVAIDACYHNTVGLKSNGTVVACGGSGNLRLPYSGQCNVSEWSDIVAIAAGGQHTVGLKADGTVVATEYTGDLEDYYGQCEVSGWKNIKLPD